MPRATQSDQQASTTHKRRRVWIVVRLGAVVALAVFAMVAALLSRTGVTYTASVPVDLAPVLRAATVRQSSDGHAPVRPPLGRLVAPGGLLAQAVSDSGFDAELDLGDSASRINSGDVRSRPFGPSSGLRVATTSDGEQDERLVVSYTAPSRETAVSRAEAAAQVIADRFAELEADSARKVYQSMSTETAAARKALERAEGQVERLLSGHFKQLGQDLKATPPSRTALPAADQEADDESAVRAPLAKTPPLPAGTTVKQLEARLGSLQAERAKLLEKLTPLHPTVRALDDQIETVKQQVSALRSGRAPEATAADAEATAPALAESPVEMPGAPISAEPGDDQVPPPWAITSPPAPDESIPPPAAPPATHELPLVAPEAVPQVNVDESTYEEMQEEIGSGAQSDDKARAYLAATSKEYREAKLARDKAQAELDRSQAAERNDWLRVARLTQARAVLGETEVTATAPPTPVRRSILGVALACALVFGLIAAWGGAVATAGFASIGEVEQALGTPVVGVIERPQPATGVRHTRRLRTWTARIGLIGELLLLAAIVWIAYLVASEPGFFEGLLTDPYEALCDAIW